MSAPMPRALQVRARILLGVGIAATLATTLLLWGITQENAVLVVFASSATSVIGLSALMAGYGLHHGAPWAIRAVPNALREAPETIAFFAADEVCPGCGEHVADAPAYCGGCGHAFHAPPEPFWAMVALSFRRLVRKTAVEPPRTAAYRRRAPGETSDMLLIAAIAVMVLGWIASNQFASFARYFIIVGVVAPVALFLVWLRKQDRFEPEPWRVLLIAFGWGMLSGVFVMPLNTLVGMFVPGMMMQAAVFEEIAKAAILVFLAAHTVLRKEINGPLDGLIYGAAAGLGFAAMENFSYVLRIESTGGTLLQAFIVRSGGIIGHMMYSGITGSFLGLMMLRRGTISPRDLLVGFLPAAVPHALNNASLGVLQLLVLPIAAGIAAWWFFKALSDGLRDEAAWGYHRGRAPVEVEETPSAKAEPA